MRDDNRPPRPQVTLHQGRARPASATLRSPTHIALKALVGRYQDLDDVGKLDAAIGAILEEKCVGSQGTVQLMIRVGDNPERLKQRVVVLLCGVAARPASSGFTTLYRLKQGRWQGRWQGSGEQRDTHRCARKAEDGREDPHRHRPQDV